MIYEVVNEIQVKCTRCGRQFTRYIYKSHTTKHKFRHHKGHRGGKLNPMGNCYYCSGGVVVK